MITGEASADYVKYGLPVIDVQTKKRNFPGYTDSVPYSLGDMQRGEPEGTTQTTKRKK